MTHAAEPAPPAAAPGPDPGPPAAAPGEPPWTRAVAGLGLLVDGSVLVPGGAALIALVFPLVYEGRVAVPATLARLLAFAGAALVAGALCRVVGGHVRRVVVRRLAPRGSERARLRRAFVAHGARTALDGRAGEAPADAPGLRPTRWSRYRNPGALADALEAAVRDDPRRAGTDRALARRALRVGTLDGLAVACLAWAAVLAVVPVRVSRWPFPLDLSLGLAAGAVALAFLLWSEAHREAKRRVEVLVAGALAGEPPPGHEAGHAPAAGHDAAAPAPAIQEADAPAGAPPGLAPLRRTEPVC